MSVHICRENRIKLSSGLELVSYLESNVPEPTRAITVEDRKSHQHITFYDYGLDGPDKIIVDREKRIEITPEWKALYDEAVGAVKLRLPAYFREISSLPQSPHISETEIGITRITGATPYYTISSEVKDFILYIPEGDASDFADSSLKINDKKIGLYVTLQSPSNAPFIKGLFDFLEPVRRLTKTYFEGDNTAIELSGKWLFFSRHEQIDEWDGVKNRDGKPSDNDMELARVLFEAPTVKKDEGEQYNTYIKLKPEDVLSLLARYKGPRDIPSLRLFLRMEGSSADSIDSKLVFATQMTRSNAHVSLDIWGRLHSTTSAQPLVSDASRPGFIFDAMDRLIRRHSGGKVLLREKTLNYLSRCLSGLSYDDTGLLFYDEKQYPKQEIIIPKEEIISLLFGSPTMCRGISVDGFYICDKNGDGRIHDFGDAILKKEGGRQSNTRRLAISSPEEMLEELGSKFPPPFNPNDFELDAPGVALTDLRKWADTIHRTLVKSWKRSSNPMADGKYRAMIYRRSPNDLNPGGIWFSLFTALNDFDDVYVVPPLWGTEIALNEIAARNLPVSHLYTGSHRDSFEFGDIPIDFDRKLKFAPGGKATFTGCYTTPERAMILGAQLFQDSKGTLIWGDGLNLPTPFGRMLSSGNIHWTTFDHGARADEPEIVRNGTYIVDPIPGGLF